MTKMARKGKDRKGRKDKKRKRRDGDSMGSKVIWERMVKKRKRTKLKEMGRHRKERIGWV